MKRGEEHPMPDDGPRNEAPSEPNTKVLLVESSLGEGDTQRDLHDLLQVLLRYKKAVGLFVAVVVSLAIAYSFLTRPIYRAQVLMLPASAEADVGGLSGLAGQLGGLATLAGIGVPGSADGARALAVLQSRSFAQSFIAEKELLPILFEEDWDADRQAWRVEDPADVPTAEDAYRKFSQDIRTVREDRETGLVVLSVDWTDRYLAAEWANELVYRVNERMRTLAIEEAQRSIDYLNAELSKSSVVGIRQGIYKIIEKQVETAMLANVNKEFAFKVIDPAVVPDEDKYVWPKKLVIIFSSLVFALLAGAFFSLVANAFIRPRSPARTT